MKLPPGLPRLPLHEKPDGSRAKLRQDSFGRWYVEIIKDEMLIDVLRSYNTPLEALLATSEEYPHASRRNRERNRT